MYGKSPTIDYFGELSKLKQEGYDYEKYWNEFMRLSHQVRGIPSEHLISCFISGLRETVKIELLSRGPRSVVDAMKLARLEEEKASAIKKGVKPNYNKNFSN